jgi:serine/threonine protein kinase
MQPTRLGPYAIRTRLGRGGMGAVYEAVDAAGAVVAVKTLAAHLGDDPHVRHRFAVEIETLKSLRHPGIVRLLAFGEEDGQPYFAMELVRGSSLEQLLRAGRRFSWQETTAAALEVVRALKVAHDQGVIHRDLKPSNLLFADPACDGVTLKLADFGIARLFGDAGQTQVGMIVGTAEYMAPEQAAGRSVDPRSDLYNLGLVMFAMLTGRPPFHGGQPADILDRQRRESPPRVAAVVPGIPPELDDLVDRLLSKDPDRRPASALATGRLLSQIDGLRDRPPPVAAPATSPAVDLEAPTRDMPVVDGGTVGSDSARTDIASRATSLASLETDPAPQHERSRGAGGSRFTTVEELDRAAKATADRTTRRQQIWQAVAAATTAAAIAAGGWLLFRPLTADELHARIMAIAGDETADLRDARPFIDRFLSSCAADPRAAEIRGLERRLDLDALERRSRLRPRPGRELPPVERDYRTAMAREAESPTACIAALEAILAVHAGPATAAADADPETALWLALVQRQVDRLGPRAAQERDEDAARIAATLREAELLGEQAAAAADTNRRRDLLARRTDLLHGLIEIYAARPHAAAAVERARTLLEPVRDPPAP